jgi:hypothetical protein
MTKPVSLHNAHGFLSYSTGCSLLLSQAGQLAPKRVTGRNPIRSLFDCFEHRLGLCLEAHGSARLQLGGASLDVALAS